VECRSAGLKVRRGNNTIRLGIMAVKSRIETGRLKVNTLRCPNLIAEAKLYRREEDCEDPVDEHNHALGAIRYLIAKLDYRFLARLKHESPAESGIAEQEGPPLAVEETLAAVHNVRPVPSPTDRDLANEDLWDVL